MRVETGKPRVFRQPEAFIGRDFRCHVRGDEQSASVPKQLDCIFCKAPDIRRASCPQKNRSAWRGRANRRPWPRDKFGKDGLPLFEGLRSCGVP